MRSNPTTGLRISHSIITLHAGFRWFAFDAAISKAR